MTIDSPKRIIAAATRACRGAVSMRSGVPTANTRRASRARRLAALYMRERLDLTLQEIGDELGVTKAAVHYMLSSAPADDVEEQIRRVETAAREIDREKSKRGLDTDLTRG